MATVKAFIRTTTKNKKVSVRIRLSDGRNRIYYGVSQIMVLPDWWNPEKEELKPRLLIPGQYSREDINSQIRKCKDRVDTWYRENPTEDLPPDWITRLLSGKMEKEPEDFFQLYDRFMKERIVSEGRREHLKVIKGDLQRFSLLNDVQITLDNFPAIPQIEYFLREEYNLAKQHPNLYTVDGKRMKIKHRGQNTINYKLKIISSFFSWCRLNKLTRVNPFETYDIPADVYGDPIPLLVEEVNKLLSYQGLSVHLAISRDMFCLQCFTGCRIGDFMSLRRENLTDDLLTYIPSKTASENPQRVYVPLSDAALDIIERFGFPEGYIVPRMDVYGKSGYNQRIKELIKLTGIDRPVAIINSITRKPEMVMLSKIASTHTARRTFINSNYMETQDPNLISMMSGHSQNSRAFARYRNIDMDLLRKQIKKTFG